MDENPLTVHDGDDFSFVNAPSPFAFNPHIPSGLFYLFLEWNGEYRIQKASTELATRSTGFRPRRDERDPSFREPTNVRSLVRARSNVGVVPSLLFQLRSNALDRPSQLALVPVIRPIVDAATSA
jgi:hypothetical protein